MTSIEQKGSVRIKTPDMSFNHPLLLHSAGIEGALTEKYPKSTDTIHPREHEMVITPGNCWNNNFHALDYCDSYGNVFCSDNCNGQKSKVNDIGFLVGDQSPYASSSIFPQINPSTHDFQFQEFQYFVVIDFEATCDKERNPHPQEIIEFPSVIVNSSTGQLEGCFQTYVRPTHNQILSDFCKELTGIQQTQVDKGVILSEALLSHDKWLEKRGVKNSKFAVVTWSNWDCQVMLESECRYKKIRKPPYFNRWINLKTPFRQVFGDSRCKLKEAVERSGLVWQGRAHCGLDDAKNTACLLLQLMHHGFQFSITNFLWSDPMSLTPIQKTRPHNPPPVYAHGPVSPQIMQVHIHPHCFCGVRSSTGIMCQPGFGQGNFFFGCGNWAAATGACCQYFQWASP